MGSITTKEEMEAEIERQHQRHVEFYEREKKAMQEIDASTKVGHLLIELRNLGFVELQGKDIGDIYSKLDGWLGKTWGARRVKQDIRLYAQKEDCCRFIQGNWVGDLQPCDELCDASYILGSHLAPNGIPVKNDVFKARGSDGENNMGKLTMQIVNYMTNTCGWTLQVCDGGNLGLYGQIREQQIKFKAPHPLNLIAPHVMIELRATGYVEINGVDSNGIFEKLHGFFTKSWRSERTTADPNYCDMKYNASSAFQKRGGEGENNMGLRTMEVVDFMVKRCAWTMITCNGGNFGRKGDKREQQLVFRDDGFVQHGENHVMLEMRTCGYIEVNGLEDAEDFAEAFDKFAKHRWRCTDYKPSFYESSTKFCDKKYTTPGDFYYQNMLANNLGKRTIELAQFAQSIGWSLLLCNGGSIITPKRRNNIIREQQVKFTRCKKKEDAAPPLLMIEMRTQPVSWNPPRWDGFIEINGGNTNGIYTKVGNFITQHLGGRSLANVSYCDAIYAVDVFRLKDHNTETSLRNGRLNGESNIGKWTMRFCDFMVDHLGEWDVVTCNSDNVDWSFFVTQDNWVSVTGREMQMVFRHKPGGGRGIIAGVSKRDVLGRPPLHAPKYWQAASQNGTVGHTVVPGTVQELTWAQQLLDGTYKNKATRDRRGRMADRFVAKMVLRSEDPLLWDKFAQRRRDVGSLRRDPAEFVVPKTVIACPELAQRCQFKGSNPANQTYLLHGTSPTSALFILENSFKVDLAGASAGTMFGPGVYLAESSSKADEYARDDPTGDYKELCAILVCRAVLGRAFVVEEPGNYAERCVSGDHDVVVGDREKAVGTYREFIFFHETSIYPEYAIFYQREYAGGAPPLVAVATPVSAPVPAPVPMTMGHATSSGPRRWQWQGDGGQWHDFAAELLQVLEAGAARAQPLRLRIGSRDVEVHFDRMSQVNMKTGRERAIRVK